MTITGFVKQNGYHDYTDYEDELDNDVCWELLKGYVRANVIRISGIEHQERFLPIIDDKYVVLLSCRVWGELMAEVWSVVDNVDYIYSQWAWWTPFDEEPKCNVEGLGI